jgi:hypothetical protein
VREKGKREDREVRKKESQGKKPVTSEVTSSNEKLGFRAQAPVKSSSSRDFVRGRAAVKLHPLGVISGEASG